MSCLLVWAARRRARALGLLLLSSALFAPPSRAVAPAPREVSWSELWAFASEHAPRLTLARQRRALGAAASAEAGAVFHENPTLSVGAGPRLAGEERGLDLQASLAQPIEIAGERGLRRVVASRFGERLAAEVGSARAELRRELGLAFHGAVLLRERAAIAARLREFAERTLAVASRRASAGDATAIDQLMAEADAARARAEELAAQQALATAMAELALIAGWPEEPGLAVPRGLAPPAPPPELEVLLEQARAQHPELVARAAATREAHARVELADRRAWPAPTLGVQVSREGSVGSPANYIVLGSVQLPLGLWSQNQGERAQSRAEEALASAEESQAGRALAVRLATAHAQLASAAARLQLLGNQAAPALESGLALLERGFASGEFSVLEVASAEERFARAELATLDARADYCAARVELEYALGTELDTSPSGASGGAQ
jgi:cobalt-zinc-cadmium efflux system outer membrane protein